MGRHATALLHYIYHHAAQREISYLFPSKLTCMIASYLQYIHSVHWACNRSI